MATSSKTQGSDTTAAATTATVDASSADTQYVILDQQVGFFPRGMIVSRKNFDPYGKFTDLEYQNAIDRLLGLGAMAPMSDPQAQLVADPNVHAVNVPDPLVRPAAPVVVPTFPVPAVPATQLGGQSVDVSETAAVPPLQTPPS